MKFNEKLIELRKKEGLSQEELGYKLNVTRQTVSKWELGQTTPEMDKLIEISKIFNTSVDELTNEDELLSIKNTKIEDQPINEKGSKHTRTAIIIIAIVVVLAIIVAFIIIKLFTGVFNLAKSGINQAGNIIESTVDMQKDILDKAGSMIENAEDNDNQMNIENVIEQADKFLEDAEQEKEEYSNRINLMQFNGKLEIYAGTTMGGTVTHVLDDIITSNKKEDKKITVEYAETETQDETQIKDIKQKIENFDNYEITFEYDDDGFINKTIIEKL